MRATIIPMNPCTGEPRRGKWVNRLWVPENPAHVLPNFPPRCLLSTNPNFSKESRGWFNLGKGKRK